ncbi:MAG: family 20 glycosylhydrolase [Acidobacteriota bacterium]|nr:family 20 glycosylhydrolase [Acidobacteriota bacterium]
MTIRDLVPILFATITANLEAAPEPLNLMPVPAKISVAQGRLPIDGKFRIAIAGRQQYPALLAYASRMISRLSRQTGLTLAPDPDADVAQASLTIACLRPRREVQVLNEDESYRLEIDSKQARLTAATPLGAMRGMETFLQLVARNGKDFAAPAVTIADRPRFPWRGLHIDVSRHWMPIEVIRRNLDGMAAAKLNVLHWHLSDDQGFRIESKTYPKLSGLGSDGDFYTQDQVREVIVYARERGIRVVPEFDIPGHTASWFVGYPELASAPGPYKIERTFDVLAPCMDPTREAVYEFLDGFIGEISRLFPDEYFHIGGDEVNGIQWDASERIQNFKREHGMKGNRELQAYFNQRVQAIVKKHGKSMEGWDEILTPGLPDDIVIQSWQGQKSLAEAARLGYRGLLSSGYYLDLMHSAAQHYAVDPLGKQAARLTPEQKKRILGGEACMWVEYATPENIDSRIWPRAAAIAERLWSPADTVDLNSMYRRLEIMSRNLETLGLTHRSSYQAMLQRLAGSGPVEPLKTLADVVEPVKEYARSSSREYTQQTPLNRLVDAARPESDVARDFSHLVNRDAVRTRLTLWRDNHAKLIPIIRRSPLLKEVEPLSSDLAKLGALGLEALAYSESGKRPPDSWIREAGAFLGTAKQPRAEVSIAVVAPIAKLVGYATRTVIRPHKN